jgi:hypothetical protein
MKNYETWIISKKKAKLNVQIKVHPLFLIQPHRRENLSVTKVLTQSLLLTKGVTQSLLPHPHHCRRFYE